MDPTAVPSASAGFGRIEVIIEQQIEAYKRGYIDGSIAVARMEDSDDCEL